MKTIKIKEPTDVDIKRELAAMDLPYPNANGTFFMVRNLLVRRRESAAIAKLGYRFEVVK